MVTVSTVNAAMGGVSCPSLSTTASHAYRIMPFAIRRAAAVTSGQSTVQAQITHTRRLSWPTYTAHFCVTLCSAARTHITCRGLTSDNRNRIICKELNRNRSKLKNDNGNSTSRDQTPTVIAFITLEITAR